MAEHLVVLLGSDRVGRLERRFGDELRILYDEGWRAGSDSIPLSLSMPLAGREHAHETVHAFLTGLLPDSAEILQGWGRRFHVSPRNTFGLLAEVGEECAGAVRFVRPERLQAALDPAAWAIEPLSEGEIAQRLRRLDQDASAWRTATDTGQFSLAGAQPKLALMRDQGSWSIPSGHAPTTHILKPPLRGFSGHVENEHLSLALARELGLDAANSEVVRFEDRIALSVERFDRARSQQRSPQRSLQREASSPPFLRIHQEDVCQALAVPPVRKYQSEGGPGAKDLALLLLEQSSDPIADLRSFVQSLAFNWFIGGTDAHAKNYAVLLPRDGSVRLAPLYDLASALPYEAFDLRRMKLALKIGSKYRVSEIVRRHWQQLATEFRQPRLRVLDLVQSMGERLPSALEAVAHRERQHGLDAAAVEAWASGIAAWVPTAMRRMEP